MTKRQGIGSLLVALVLSASSVTAGELTLRVQTAAGEVVLANQPVTLQYELANTPVLTGARLDASVTVDGAASTGVTVTPSATGGSITLPATLFATVGGKRTIVLRAKYTITDATRWRCSSDPNEVAGAAPFPLDCGESVSAPLVLTVGQPVTPKPPTPTIRIIRTLAMAIDGGGRLLGYTTTEMHLGLDGVWKQVEPYTPLATVGSDSALPSLAFGLPPSIKK